MTENVIKIKQGLHRDSVPSWLLLFRDECLYVYGYTLVLIESYICVFLFTLDARIRLGAETSVMRALFGITEAQSSFVS